jgi:hypothetical protein
MITSAVGSATARCAQHAAFGAEARQSNVLTPLMAETMLSA